MNIVPSKRDNSDEDMGDRQQQPPDSLGNFSDMNSYVVGIPLSPSTLYVDHPSDNNNRSYLPPNELGFRKRSGTSFQITSVTVQGHRLNNDECGDDSADDYDDSHTDDVSSDILDSSKFTEPDGYQSEDNTTNNLNNTDDMSSPCGPLIITPFPTVATTTTNSNSGTTMNVGLGIDMSPPFSAVGTSMMSNGVTMMTSSSNSPVSAQVHPLPDNWQHRFKVVKIVSSEPFLRGRWTCMDFRDPPAPQLQQTNNNNNNNSKGELPSIQVTPSSQDIIAVAREEQQLNALNKSVAHVYEINAANVIGINNQPNQPIYGIFLPQYINENIAQYTNVGVPVGGISVAHQLPVIATDAAQLQQQQSFVPNALVGGIDGVVQGSVVGDMSSVSAFQCQPVLDGNANKLEQPYPIINGHQEPGMVTPLPQPRMATDVVVVPSSVPVDYNDSIVPVDNRECLREKNFPVESTESAASTGASTVAIDNKIEQAMDLVKSHLMFAVREEVEVLKEKITELLERISQLEHENDILRANASPETLKQLNQSQKKFSGHSVIGSKQQTLNQQNQPPAS